MQYPIAVPELVQAAKRLTDPIGFDLRPEGNRAGQESAGPSACFDEAGSLLRILTASRPEGRIGGVGTGSGVGTAWMASALAQTASMVSVELDARLAAAARDFFAARNPEGD